MATKKAEKWALDGIANRALGLTNDGASVLAFERGGRLERFERRTGTKSTFRLDEALEARDATEIYEALAVSPRDAVFAVAADAGVGLFDLEGGLVRFCKAPTTLEGVNDIVFGPSGDVVALASGHLNAARSSIEIWKTSGEHVRSIVTRWPRAALAFTPDGTAVVTTDDALELWGLDGKDRSIAAALGPNAIEIDPSGCILSVSDGYSLRLHDEGGALLWQHHGPFGSARFDAPGERIVASMTNTACDRRGAAVLRIYARSGELLHTIERPNAYPVEDQLFLGTDTIAAAARGVIEIHDLGAKSKNASSENEAAPPRTSTRASPSA